MMTLIDGLILESSSDYRKVNYLNIYMKCIHGFEEKSELIEFKKEIFLNNGKKYLL